MLETEWGICKFDEQYSMNILYHLFYSMFFVVRKTLNNGGWGRVYFIDVRNTTTPNTLTKPNLTFLNRMKIVRSK